MYPFKPINFVAPVLLRALKGSLIFLWLLILNPAYVKSQDHGFLTIKGKVVLDEKGLSGVKATLFKNGKKIDQQTTSNSGRFTFIELALTVEGDEYIIKISKPGHVAIKHWVSTKIPARFKGYPTYAPNVELFKMLDDLEKEKALTSILDKPISKFSYNSRIDKFEDDKAYFSTIKAKVDRLFEILDAEEREQYRLLAEYRRKKMEENKRKEAEAEARAQREAKEKEFKKTIQKADKAFLVFKFNIDKSNDKIEKSGNEARILYKQALAILPGAKHPKEQINKINKMLARIKELIASGETESVTEDTVAEISEEADTIIGVDEEESALSVQEEPEESTETITEGEPDTFNALVERDRLLKEEKEEIDNKRKEIEANAFAEQAVVQADTKEKTKSLLLAAKEKEIQTTKSKNVKAQNSKHFIEMMAEVKLEEKKAMSEGTTGDTAFIAKLEREESSTEKSREFEKNLEERGYVKSEKTLIDKPKPLLTGTVFISEVKLVHNKPAKKVSKTQVKKRAMAKEFSFKPKTVTIVNEGTLKTVKSTIIKYPAKQDTLQEVSYVWGRVYYYKNGEELDKVAFNREKFKVSR